MKKQETEEIILKPIKLKEATITIKGTTPLIVNNFSEKSRQQILDAQMKKTKTKELRNPVEEKKIPEKIDNFIISVGRVDDSNIEEYIQKLFEQQYEVFNKINEIIDYLDYLKSKGE